MVPPITKQIFFNNHEKKVKHPFVIYARIETILVQDQNPKLIRAYQPCGFAYSVKCSYDDLLCKYEDYVGEDCVQVFWEKIEEEATLIANELKVVADPKTLNDEQVRIAKLITKCYLCGKSLHGDKLEDYCQITGDFLGIAHEQCCNKRKLPDSVPVVIENLVSDIQHHILKNVPTADIWFVGDKKFGFVIKKKLRFIDSMLFLNEEAWELESTLTDSKKYNLSKAFPQKTHFDLLKKKSRFPYKHVISMEQLQENNLPDKNGFYDMLQEEDISDEEYNTCEKIWTTFQCKTIADYFILRLKSSVLILEDIFENFRSLVSDKYNLDPVHYYTIAAISWDAMLKYIDEPVEILQDQNMVKFIRENIRGGLLQCSKRYAKANNKFCTYYNKAELDTWIVYLDANNLGGWAMSQMLPCSEFSWLNKDEIKNLDIQSVTDDSSIGYILEVDLDYPVELHQLHNDLPFCFEYLKVPPGAIGSKLKPVLTLYDKKKYVIDYRSLNQCLVYGLQLKKIHRVLKFKQRKWLEPYIAYNTQLRANASTEFEIKLYKLLNNAIYGKTIQRTGRDKPIYAGFCILELSKRFIYNFHYNHMKNKYPNKLNLLYVDTDCLAYEIQTSNFFQDLKTDTKFLQLFDTSNLDDRWGVPNLHKKVLGKMKEEYCGKVIREFCGVGAKFYCLDVENEDVKKAVGVRKYVKAKKVSRDDYRECVLQDKLIRKSFIEDSPEGIHKMTRTVLSPGDTKRFILPDKINTRAWGHRASV